MSLDEEHAQNQDMLAQLVSAAGKMLGSTFLCRHYRGMHHKIIIISIALAENYNYQIHPLLA
jgi:hypothetical protein